MELSQLEQFVTIVRCGTVSKAAEELFISQPALSRSMQKFEQELGVELFTHSKNKLFLNENGKFALNLAEDILKSTANFSEQVREFDRANRTIAVASCAPAPLWEILPFLSSLYPEKRLTSEVAENAKLFDGLKAGTYQIIISTEKNGRSRNRLLLCRKRNASFECAQNSSACEKEGRRAVFGN